jgi:hypothetical protein
MANLAIELDTGNRPRVRRGGEGLGPAVAVERVGGSQGSRFGGAPAASGPARRLQGGRCPAQGRVPGAAVTSESSQSSPGLSFTVHLMSQ